MLSASFARALEDSWDAAAAAKAPTSSLALAPNVFEAQENAAETTTTGGKAPGTQEIQVRDILLYTVNFFLSSLSLFCHCFRRHQLFLISFDPLASPPLLRRLR